MIFLLMLSIFLLCIGVACLGIGKIKKEKNFIEWGETFACSSIFPFLIILMCIL